MCSCNKIGGNVLKISDLSINVSLYQYRVYRVPERLALLWEVVGEMCVLPAGLAQLLLENPRLCLSCRQRRLLGNKDGY